LGINSQIISRSGSNSGVGFAVPVNIAKRVVPTLIDGDPFRYAWLGIRGGSVTSAMAEFRGVAAKGARVLEVVEDGPADKGGLQGVDTRLDRDSDDFLFGGDIITAINGVPINGMDDLIAYLATDTGPGEVVTLDLIRADGSQTQLEVELGVRPR
jgi:S1-C subfamily serine protease